MCIRHVCHVSHVNGGCHVLIMWIGATVAWQLMHGSLDGRAPGGSGRRRSRPRVTGLIARCGMRNMCLVDRGGDAAGHGDASGPP